MNTTGAQYAKQHDVTQAAAVLREAQISLSIAIQQTYPVGSLVVARIAERKITVCITGFGPYGSSPGDLIGNNVATGKRRRFHHAAILHAVADW